MTTTNYFNTLIEIAEDCTANSGEMPPIKSEKRSVANHQFDMIYEHPYRYTSDEVLFTVFATRKEVPSFEREDAKEDFFSKGQPCFRASPLPKRYGWGIHSDAEGRIAMVAVGSETYTQLLQDPKVAKTKAMRSKRAK